MTGEEIKRMSWAARRGRLNGLRERVWVALGQARDMRVPGLTTRSLADALGVDILCVRPRVTELCQLGLARCVGGVRHEGLYAQVSLAEAEEAYRRESSPQMEMEL